MIKFTPSAMYDHLTVVVCRNLVSLHYPFIESLWSAIPLGCRFLVGNFQSTDNSEDFFRELGKHAPVDIIHGRWQPETGGTAIGIATQLLLDHAPTPFVYNLQACEVLDDNFPAHLHNFFHKEMVAGVDPGPKAVNSLDNGCPAFRHIWGNFRFDGRIHGAGYGSAQRMMRKTARIDQNDGCNPVEAGGFDLTWVYRYAYCFRNQVQAKVPNHINLYGHGKQKIKEQFDSIEWCRNNPNYDGPHPSYVAHLRDRENYDANFSLEVFRQHVQTL